MKNIAVIGTVGIPACYGGFESLVENLTINKSNATNYAVFCSSKSYNEKLPEYNKASLHYIPLKANGIQSIPYDILSMIRTWVLKPDVVLILGVSGCVFLPVFKLFSSSKVIVNIDGLEWKREKWGKWVRRFLKLSESIAVKHSDVIVTDNQAISDYVFDEYGLKSETIAYGGDHAIPKSMVQCSKHQLGYALGLCRIEPENNVEMILEAYSKTTNHLKFVGNWAASEFGRKLKRTYSKCDNIELLDPIYNIEELFRLRSGCALYLHGHSAGGTNPSLVEMMHFGIPILAFDCSFNRYSTEDKASYFRNSDDLVRILNTGNSEISFEANGKYMKKIASVRYTWEIIARQYEETYL
jgi:glycosyltransferase involved in cell wall biosynthesis